MLYHIIILYHIIYMKYIIFLRYDIECQCELCDSNGFCSHREDAGSLSFTDAVNECTARNLELPVPGMLSDSNVVTDGGTVGPVWLGIKDAGLGDGSNNWQNYYDGSTPSYFNWAGGESNQCCRYEPFIDMPAEQEKGWNFVG